MEKECLFSCEEWRKIEEHPGYFVSNQERLRHNDKLLQGSIRRGRRRVSFGRGTETNFHIVVAKAFPEICGTWFPGCHVHHIDFNKLNNKPENLVVLTRKEHNKLHSLGNKNPNAKPILQFTLDGEFIQEWACAKYAINSLGLDQASLSMHLHGKTKTCGGFKWKFA